MPTSRRRQFLGLIGLAGLTTLTTGPAIAQQTITTKPFNGLAVVTGDQNDLPDPNGTFFDNKPVYHYLHIDPQTGVWHTIETGDNEWRTVPAMPGIQAVTQASDLPDPTGGVRQLEDNTVYFFTDFVTDPSTLELGTNTPLLGWHGAASGYIHTGGGTCLQGTDAGFFARNAYFHAPGGTLFDLTANNTVEMLVESCGFSDAAGIANISSLGTIDGYRVPTFKGCNFEDFDAGLEFDGDPDKIFIWGCPLRNVTASAVDMFTLKSTVTCQLVDFSDNYVKDVQADTVVWRVEAGGEPAEILQYRGTLHDTSFGGKNQAIAGAVDVDSVGVRVSDAFPLTDWAINGDLDIDGAATVPSASSTTEVISANFSAAQTFTLSESVRTSKLDEGRLQYDAKDNAITRVFLILSLTASNTTVSVFVGKNGNDLERSQSQVQTQGAGNPVTVPATTNVRLTEGDFVSAFVRDDDGSNDIEIETMALTLGPA